MRRRAFITLLGGTAAAWPLAVGAQQAGRNYRIGFFGGALETSRGIRGSNVMGIGYPAFRDELRKRGLIDGRNLVIEFRSTRQDAERLHADAAELVRSDVDLIVAAGPEVAVKAALAASRTVPIVMWANNFDPLSRGYVQSLARPGGNITGRASRNWPPSRSRY